MVEWSPMHWSGIVAPATPVSDSNIFCIALCALWRSDRGGPGSGRVRPGKTVPGAAASPTRPGPGRCKDDPRSQTGEHGRPMSRLNAPCDSFLMGCPSNCHAPVSDLELAKTWPFITRSARSTCRSKQNSNKRVQRRRSHNCSHPRCLPLKCNNDQNVTARALYT